jgi:hypothetical protein
MEGEGMGIWAIGGHTVAKWKIKLRKEVKVNNCFLFLHQFGGKEKRGGEGRGVIALGI